MTRAIKDAKAASNTYCAMITDTLTYFKGKNRLTPACEYIDGYLSPHYPVPAIRLEVDICKTWSNTVAIHDVEWGHTVYEYFTDDPIQWGEHEHR